MATGGDNPLRRADHAINGSTRKFKDLSGAENFSDPGRQARARIAMARECMDYIAGSRGDGDLLLKHLCGHANQTADRTLALFNELPAGALRAEVGFGPGQRGTGVGGEIHERG